jgi:4-amino-4-deoxy-L-arabinose transferase-like glycosyltransferase
MTGRRLLLSGAALTALLAVVAVASRAHKPGGGTSGGGAKVPPVLLDYLGVAALVTIVLGGAVMVFTFADQRRRKALAGETGWRRSLGGVVFAMLALLAAVVLTRHAHHLTPRPLGAFGPTGTLQTGTTGSGAAGRAAHQPQSNESSWLGAVILGSMLLGLVAAVVSAAMYRRRHGQEMHDEAALAAALDAVLADTLVDLYAERDPRAAVIGAYARMEETFAAYRVPRREAETPLEYLARVLDSLSVSSWAVRRLTLLFERAKFSSHEVDSTMKEDAIATLASLRAELEADEEDVA